DKNKKPAPTEEVDSTLEQIDVTGAAGKEGTTNPEADLARHYCLYIRYCEEMTDPVSPYATDEPCGLPACEPTRVREGFRFELRCREEKKPHADFLSRICGCIGDMISAEKIVIDAKSLYRFQQQAEPAFIAAKKQPDVTFDQTHIVEMKTAATNAQKAIEALGA